MNSLITNEMKLACRAETREHVNIGLIVKKPCEVCGEVEVQAHHTDYTKPFQVQWLCYRHHLKAHGRHYRFGKSSQMRHEKVMDSRNRRVRGLWERAGVYYVQMRLYGKAPTRFRLKNADGTAPQTVPQAVAAMHAVLVDKRAGKATPPKSELLTVATICQRYLDDGCPCRDDRRQRAGNGPKHEVVRVQMLLRSPIVACQASALTAQDWDKYAKWRRTQLPKKQDGTFKGRGGDRAVDKERITLSNAYRRAIWHSAETGIKINQVTALNFRRYRDPKKVVHCRSHKPRGGDELHDLARLAFTSGPRTEVLGWFALFAARIGHREEALLTLRADAKFPSNAEWPQPGFVGPNHISPTATGTLYLFRAGESDKGTVGHLEVEPDLKSLLEAHRAWLARRHPTSPFYFPSPYYPNLQTIRNESLTHWLKKVCPGLGLGHRTTHGLRSFRATCLRSQGKSAAETAELLGQKTAGLLVTAVYAERLDVLVDWMPSKGPPAWTVFETLANVVKLPNQAA